MQLPRGPKKSKEGVMCECRAPCSILGCISSIAPQDFLIG